MEQSFNIIIIHNMYVIDGIYYTSCRECVNQVWSVVLDRDDASPALKTQALLTLGAMSRRVRPSHHNLATQIVADLHHLLEKHTGIFLV